MKDSEPAPREVQPLQLAVSTWWWIFVGTAAFSFVLSRDTGAPWEFYAFNLIRGAVFVLLSAFAARTGKPFIGWIAIALFVGSSMAAQRFVEQTAGRAVNSLQMQCLFIALAGVSLILAVFGRRLFPGRKEEADFGDE